MIGLVGKPGNLQTSQVCLKTHLTYCQIRLFDTAPKFLENIVHEFTETFTEFKILKNIQSFSYSSTFKKVFFSEKKGENEPVSVELATHSECSSDPPSQSTNPSHCHSTGRHIPVGLSTGELACKVGRRQKNSP